MTHPTTTQSLSMQKCVFAMLTLLLLTSTTGCAFGRATLGDTINPEEVTNLTKGVTSRDEVVARIGTPDRMLQANGREVLQYYHYDMKSSSLLLLLVNFSRFNIKSDDLYVLINQDGLVDDVLYGRRTNQLRFQAWPFGD